MTDFVAIARGRLRKIIWIGVCIVQVVLLGTIAPLCLADTLTIEQCLVLAKANSPIIKQADLALRSGFLGRQEVGKLGLPQLRISAGASFAPGTRHFGYDPALSNKGQFGSQVILEQQIFDGGRRRLKAMQGEIDISRFTKVQQIAVRDVEFEVRQSCVENLRAQREVQLRQQSVRELTEYLDVVRRLNAGGLVAYTDLLRIQVELATATTALSQSEQSLAESKYRLAGLIGDPSDTLVVVGDSLGESTPLNLDTTNLTGIPDTSRNLELSVARLEYQRSVMEIKESQKERLPIIALVADAGLLTSRENLMLPASDRFTSLGYSVGLSFDMPLFDWGGRKLRVQQKQLAAELAQLQIDFIRRSYETEYRSALKRLASSRSRLIVIRDAVRKAEDNFLLTKSKYTAGGASATDVLSAQHLLSESKIAELETLSSMQEVVAEIARLAAN